MRVQLLAVVLGGGAGNFSATYQMAELRKTFTRGALALHHATITL